MKITYSGKSDAAYISLRTGEISETIEVNLETYIDVDARRYVLGIETISPKRSFDKIVKQGGVFNLPERINANTFIPKSLFAIQNVKESTLPIKTT